MASGVIDAVGPLLMRAQAAVRGLDPATSLAVALALLVVYLSWEQAAFALKHRSRLPGPSLAVPLLGGIVEMVMDPYGFWERQREYTNTSAGGLHSAKMSWNSIMGKARKWPGARPGAPPPGPGARALEPSRPARAACRRYSAGGGGAWERRVPPTSNLGRARRAAATACGPRPPRTLPRPKKNSLLNFTRSS